MSQRLATLPKTAEVYAGFSLVELLVVVVIVGVLASVGLPLAELAHKRTQEEELRQALRAIRSALDSYKKAFDDGHIVKNVGDSGFPPTLDALTNGVPDAQSPKGEKMYFMRSLPRDPFTPEGIADAAETWALRSYESQEDNPRPGKDVFDVHSKSNELGSNGVPYSKW